MVTIRAEEPADIPAIDQILAAAFGRVEADLVHELRGAGALTAGLVAVREGSVAGYVAFSPIGIAGEAGGGRWQGLAPLAVRPGLQRRGIGTALVENGIGLLAKRGVELVVVLGDPGYYGRFGFVPAARAGLGCVWPVPPEAFMMLRLDKGARLPPGRVEYHPAFAALQTISS
jgi:putative acetyltransferase